MPVRACILNRHSGVQLCVTLWTIACQAPLSMGFSRQEYWSGLPWDLFLQGIFLTQGLNLCLLHLFTTSAIWEALLCLQYNPIHKMNAQSPLNLREYISRLDD